MQAPQVHPKDHMLQNYENLVYVEDVPDKLFGNVMIYRLHPFVKYAAAKLVPKRNISYQERLNLKHPSVFQIIKMEQHPQEMKIYFEYDFQDLKSLIEKRRENKWLLPECELWQMIRQLCSALSYLQSKNIWHGNITANNVFFDDEYMVYKLYDNCLLNGEAEGYSNFENPNEESLLAPELLKQYANQDMVLSTNMFKSDMFSFGMLILNAGTLLPIMDCYVKEQYSLNYNNINQYMTLFAQRYSPQLLNLLQQLLEFDVNKRIDWYELKEIILEGQCGGIMKASFQLYTQTLQKNEEERKQHLQNQLKQIQSVVQGQTPAPKQTLDQQSVVCQPLSTQLQRGQSMAQFSLQSQQQQQQNLQMTQPIFTQPAQYQDQNTEVFVKDAMKQQEEEGLQECQLKAQQQKLQQQQLASALQRQYQSLNNSGVKGTSKQRNMHLQRKDIDLLLNKTLDIIRQAKLETEEGCTDNQQQQYQQQENCVIGVSQQPEIEQSKVQQDNIVSQASQQNEDLANKQRVSRNDLNQKDNCKKSVIIDKLDGNPLQNRLTERSASNSVHYKEYTFEGMSKTLRGHIQRQVEHNMNLKEKERAKTFRKNNMVLHNSKSQVLDQCPSQNRDEDSKLYNQMTEQDNENDSETDKNSDTSYRSSNINNRGQQKAIIFNRRTSCILDKTVVQPLSTSNKLLMKQNALREDTNAINNQTTYKRIGDDTKQNKENSTTLPSHKCYNEKGQKDQNKSVVNETLKQLNDKITQTLKQSNDRTKNLRQILKKIQQN